jgi:hypothetical protein
MLCKSALTSFSLNCGPQQASDIVLIKHKRVEAQISSDHDRTRLVALGHRVPKRMLCY